MSNTVTMDLVIAAIDKMNEMRDNRLKILEDLNSAQILLARSDEEQRVYWNNLSPELQAAIRRQVKSYY